MLSEFNSGSQNKSTKLGWPRSNQLYIYYIQSINIMCVCIYIYIHTCIHKIRVFNPGSFGQCPQPCRLTVAVCNFLGYSSVIKRGLLGNPLLMDIVMGMWSIKGDLSLRCQPCYKKPEAIRSGAGCIIQHGNHINQPVDPVGVDRRWTGHVQRWMTGSPGNVWGTWSTRCSQTIGKWWFLWTRRRGGTFWPLH